MKLLGGVLSVTGVLLFIVGGFSACGTVLGKLQTMNVLLAILGLGGGLALIWAGNRLQGYGMIGKRKKVGHEVCLLLSAPAMHCGGPCALED